VKKKEQDVTKKEEPNGAAVTKDHELVLSMQQAFSWHQVILKEGRTLWWIK
jgi:hypothetical protein